MLQGLPFRRRDPHARERGRVPHFGACWWSIAVCTVIVNIGVSTLASNGAVIFKPHLAIHVRSHAPTVVDELRRASMDVVRVLGAIGVQADFVLEVPDSRRPPRRPAQSSISCLTRVHP
jgi:hypothetical protein